MGGDLNKNVGALIGEDVAGTDGREGSGAQASSS